MTLFVYHIDNTTNIKIWNRTNNNCVVQEFRNGERSKKATAKIQYYNGKPYINCKGHRYYLDKFTQIEI